MRLPSFLLLMALLHHGACLPQQNTIGHGFELLLTTLTGVPSAWYPNVKTNELKLSPVPPESEAGLPSPPVAEPLETEYEVHEAPTAPHNYILQPVSQGTRPGGAHQSPSHEKPLVYGTNDHYFINQQGHLVQKPQRPQYGLGQVSGRPPSLNFNESPPPFPHLTDEELYILGQPAPVHQVPHQGNGTRSPDGVEQEMPVSFSSEDGLMEAKSNVTNITSSIQSQATNTSSQSTASPSAMLPNLPQLASYQPSNPPIGTYQPSPTNQLLLHPMHNPLLQTIPQNPSVIPQTQSSTPPNQLSSLNPPFPFQYPSAINQSPMAQNGPAGVYIATVNYGPSEPSLVYTCIPTVQFKPGQGEYVQGLHGYSCKMSKGPPSLASQILTANNQKPVKQPVLSTEPLSLPIVTPIKFDVVAPRYV